MRAAVTTEERRRRLAEFAGYCVESGRSSRTPLVRRPLTTVRSLLDVLRLPTLTAQPSAGVEGDAVRSGLQRRRPTHTPLDALVSVLVLPDTLEEYVQTPARRPIRRKVRAAAKVPISWAPVDDPQVRRELVALADERERAHPDLTYRIEQPDNGDLVDIGLWLLASAPDGRPLLLAVVPVAGEWATLRYFRTLATGDDATVARYLLTEVLIGELIARGVRYLADTMSPFVLPNGLRHFQRMVGYELFRLRLLPSAGPKVVETVVAAPQVAEPAVAVARQAPADS